jgi:bacterial/archaeal transporter family-2 protein
VNERLLLAALALIVGAMLTAQAAINAQLKTQVGSGALAALLSFATGTLAMLGVWLLQGAPNAGLKPVLAMPLWMWIGGALGAAYVFSAILIVPKLGAANLLVLAVAGQLVAAVVLDHYGWIGLPEHPVSALRLLGVVLVFVGMVLVMRN